MTKKLTIKDLEDRGLILYKYVRGSQAYHLNTPESDVDMCYVYACPPEQLLGMGLDFQDEVLEDNNNICAFSLKKWCNLLLKSNPTVLEGLVINEPALIEYEHPCITEIKKHSNMFLTKQCFNAFKGYSMQQYKNAKNVKRKAYNPVEKKLCGEDFTYTFHKDGSSKIANWCEYRSLSTKYFGIIAVSNMQDVYTCHYDWGADFTERGITAQTLIDAYNNKTEYDLFKLVKDWKTSKETDNTEETERLAKLMKEAQFQNMVHYIMKIYEIDDKSEDVEAELIAWYEKHKTPIGYRGMFKDENSTQIRLSSVEKDDAVLCHISFNALAFEHHLRDWSQYQDWLKHRNEARWAKVMEGKRGYDAKAMAEAIRLCRVGAGIARDGVFYINRENIDREEILAIKRGNVELQTALDTLDASIKDMEDAMANSTIPDGIDADWLNNWLVKVQTEFTRDWLNDMDYAQEDLH